MFCPNCGKEIQNGQTFCRSCGLRLDGVADVVAKMLPSAEDAAFRKRRLLLQRLGVASLSVAAVIGLMSVIFAVGLYKLILFGPGILFLASSIAFAAFLLIAAGLLGYSRFFMRGRTADILPVPVADVTGKLLEERFFEPTRSVTENSTELLPRESGRNRI